MVDQQGFLVDLVDDTAGGAAAKQHGRRATQHFDAVVVEGVAFVLRRVLHAVDHQIADSGYGKAAQADVLVGAVLGGGKGDAGGVVQGLLEGVELGFVHQALGHHRQRLRNVADILFAFADVGFLRLQLVFGLHLSRLLDRHRAHGGFGGGGLGPTADRGCEHQSAQRKQCFFG